MTVAPVAFLFDISTTCSSTGQGRYARAAEHAIYPPADRRVGAIVDILDIDLSRIKEHAA